MSRRLNETAARAAAGNGAVGRDICRNCGGEIIVDGADHRDMRLPHRRVCRKCGVEYGTTPATLYPSRQAYSD
jgi:hypothetical protein